MHSFCSVKTGQKSVETFQKGLVRTKGIKTNLGEKLYWLLIVIDVDWFKKKKKVVFILEYATVSMKLCKMYFLLA